MSNIYNIITNNLIAALENVDPNSWEMPWDRANGGMPTNTASKKAYRGINVLQLWMSNYSSSVWGTYRQWKAQGNQVQKGEKGTTVVFYKPIEKTQKDGTVDKFLLARAYTVFNIEQTDAEIATDDVPRDPLATHKAAEGYLVELGATIKHGGGRAFYQPREDFIQLPDRDAFKSTEDYYSTSFHEHVHWSGNKARTDRDLTGRFGDESYAAEELVAELGAAFLCHKTGVTKTPRCDHAKYLKNWLQVLKNDEKAIFTASSKAQQALDWMEALQEKASTQKLAA